VPDEFVCRFHLPPLEGEPDGVARVLFGWNDPQLAGLLANPNLFIHGFENMQIPVQLLGPDFHVPAPPPAVPHGAVFAADPQNVHRREVSAQTNKATEFLLKINVPIETAAHLWRDVAVAFAALSDGDYAVENFNDVMRDVEKGWKMKTCREEGDHLYMLLMDGLVTYIKTSEHKEDLWKRLWQECSDAVGMCCEGHISRLCNVLVGYVEGLDPPVALGELIQQKMAAIAGQEIPEADKRRMANQFFEEHAVPEAERAAWLDAF